MCNPDGSNAERAGSAPNTGRPMIASPTALGIDDDKKLAKWCYPTADAMLAERKRGGA